MPYIHELSNWPNFHWDADKIGAPLAAVRHRQGRLIGRMEGLGFDLRNQAMLVTLTEDVLKSSEIEGEDLDKQQVRSSIARRLGINITGLEDLDKQQVRSSIARRLGINITGLVAADRNVEGVVEMMLDGAQNFDQPLSAERLYAWHAALFPTGRSGMARITVGAWRADKGDPMQVVSGPYGREQVHFEAPSAARLDHEMGAFLEWFASPPAQDPVLTSALAHLWFVTIHPFEDGNGRIARAIADMALARSENSPQRFYSMSAEIRQRRKGYYDVLEATQKSGLDITEWLLWFLACLDGALERSEAVLKHVFAKAAFWETNRDAPLNDRQRLMLNRLLDGFEGKLNSSKWAKIARTSQDTALRDIEALIALGILEKEPGGGRSTSYALVGIGND